MNMTKFLSFKKEYVPYTLAILFGLLMSAMAANAATTISTNVNTAGTLTVTLTSTLTGAVTMSSTLAVTGTTTATGGVIIGSSGTAMNKVLSGTCPLLANFSMAATSTRNVPCAASEEIGGERVLIQLSSTTVSSWGSVIVVGATASTTAGQIDVTLLNLTGAAIVPTATPYFGSSTQYWIVR